MARQVFLGLKTFFAAMSHHLLQNLVIYRLTETQSVLAHIVADKLCYREVDGLPVFGLKVFVDNLLAIANNGFYQQVLYLLNLVADGMQTDSHGLALRLALLLDGVLCLLAIVFLFLLLAITTNHAVHRLEQGFLLDAQTARQLGQILIAQQVIIHHRDTLHNTTDSLRTLHGVAHVLNRQFGFERDKVLGMLFDIRLELLGGMLT